MFKSVSLFGACIIVDEVVDTVRQWPSLCTVGIFCNLLRWFDWLTLVRYGIVFVTICNITILTLTLIASRSDSLMVYNPEKC